VHIIWHFELNVCSVHTSSSQFLMVEVVSNLLTNSSGMLPATSLPIPWRKRAGRGRWVLQGRGRDRQPQPDPGTIRYLNLEGRAHSCQDWFK